MTVFLEKGTVRDTNQNFDEIAIKFRDGLDYFFGRNDDFAILSDCTTLSILLSI